MSEDRKKSVYFLKEFSSKLRYQMMKHAPKQERSADNSFDASAVRLRVLSQLATRNESVLKKCDQFCYNPWSCIIDRETSSLEFFAPNLGDVVRG